MDNDGKFISPKQIRQHIEVSHTTLHRWDSQGKIRSIRTPMGARRYCLEDIQDLLHRHDNPPEKKKICYCRVSSSKQMDDLERQKNYFRSIYPDHQLVTDIGSGINWKRKGLQAILEQAMSGVISEIVVAHRDRLCRFAFELLESIFSRCQVKLVVLDAQEHQSSDSDLADDILSIIHIYSCRSMGKRRYQNKKDKDLSHCSSENHHDAMDGHETLCVQQDSSCGKNQEGSS
jgi:predicted site-specific integrase-resolvase